MEDEIKIPKIEWAKKRSIETESSSNEGWYNNIMKSIINAIDNSANNGMRYAIVLISDERHIIKIPRTVMKRIKKDLKEEKYKIFYYKNLFDGSVKIKIKW